MVGPVDQAHARAHQTVLQVTRPLRAAVDLAQAERLADAALPRLLALDRSACLLFDQDADLLWSELDGRECTAGRGVAGFVARTGAAVMLERAGADPRHDPAIDDPRGDGTQRLLAVPVVDAWGEVHAVLLAIRDGDRPPFTAGDRSACAALAAQLAPVLDTLGPPPPTVDPLFRPQALAAHARPREHGEVLRVMPSWIGHATRLLVAVAVAMILALVFATVDETAVGPAIVRVDGVVDVTTTTAGTLQGYAVAPGQRVHTGDLLARLHAGDEAAEADQVERQYEAELAASLYTPGDARARSSLGDLAAQRRRARARVDARDLRAPRDGVVGDLQAAPGQRVEAGDAVLSLRTAASGAVVTVLLPARQRPRLRPGMPLQVRLGNRPGDVHDLEISAVDDRVIGPAEAARALGPRLADALELRGPLVRVHATLAAPALHDGMQGLGEVRLGRVRLAARVLPWLREAD